MAANTVTSGSVVAGNSNILQFRANSGRTIVQHQENLWTKTVFNRLDELLRLPVGWDGYGGGPIKSETAFFAMNMLQAICPGDMDAPQLVPGPSGDLQVEWHYLHSTIELHVRGPNRVEAWRCTPATDPDGEELALTNDFSQISNWISQLHQVPPVAANAAAG